MLDANGTDVFITPCDIIGVDCEIAWNSKSVVEVSSTSRFG